MNEMLREAMNYSPWVVVLMMLSAGMVLGVILYDRFGCVVS